MPYTDYCPACDTRRRIMESKPWLADVCLACGRNVEAGDSVDRRRSESRAPE